MRLTRSQLQAVIETCEFDRWMNLQVEALDDKTLTMRLPFRAEIVGTPKVDRLHGGVVASLIDVAGCYLLIALLNKRVSTVNLVVDFLRPAHGELIAVARMVKMGRSVCNLTVEVTGSDGKLAATGRLVIVPSNVTVGEEHQMIGSTASRGSEQEKAMRA
ncbi:MAG: PaaI family thioesterase [Rhodocyclaceae bacterium]|nr:PaaI family thioesterase [Rhodocyclaceae bacterium]